MHYVSSISKSCRRLVLLFLLISSGLSSTHAFGVESEAPSETGWTRYGRWIKVDRFNFINPVTHQILRIYEGTQKDYEHQWSLYLIDLKKKSVRKLMDLEEPFLSGTADGLPHVYFSIFSVALCPREDAVLIGTSHPLNHKNPGSGMANVEFRKASFGSPKESAIKLLTKVEYISGQWAAGHIWMHGILDPKENVFATNIFRKKGTFGQWGYRFLSIEDGSDKGIIWLPPNQTGWFSGTLLNKGRLAFTGAKNIISIKTLGSRRLEQIKPPGVLPHFYLSSTLDGSGLIAVGSPLKNTKKGFHSTLWIKPDITKGNWQRVCDIPYYNQYWGTNFSNLCTDLDNKHILLPADQTRGSWSWHHHGGYGYGHSSKMILHAFDVSNGRSKTLWRQHQVEALFFTHLATPQNGKKNEEMILEGDGLEIGKRNK